ncbi:hypothetical protein SAMN05444487_11520 [Marininema mesophilum]|uniref:Spore germination protein gerPA/gerPF n=1 Tax=Marininema mesophilum TaxID=1048340 RepID=A0A1H3B3N1_9BACL|nr:hypothetical protein [Marininema mesophilum]SDX36288.1 hypothetical protein SAMN05444487_11520 [Marininema mesophilum]
MAGTSNSINNSRVINNITNFKIVSISGGMIALGNGFNVGASSDSDQVGGSTVTGDFNKSIDMDKNLKIEGAG